MSFSKAEKEEEEGEGRLRAGGEKQADDEDDDEDSESKEATVLSKVNDYLPRLGDGVLICGCDQCLSVGEKRANLSLLSKSDSGYSEDHPKAVGVARTISHAAEKQR